ncbi:CAAX amino terminal protease self- immunity [Thalassoglobus neptunius]|uniref:CAAX amino terminal protease self-immunity n=1 Tax=Thalassoglobus neptunius TaxID=1938619 RepID=A0A5C5WNA7_9PLAN|nr:type II CAAX endopeptidase family protein [Thalassoglobus neptunius]TWT52316.1 CAAX amino terminal protease self- immunity [Thalassoglobus neptunius]
MIAQSVPTTRIRLKSLRALAEALLWAGSYSFAQLISFVVFVSLLFTAAFGFQWPDHDRLMQFALELGLDQSFVLIGVTSLGALILLVPLVAWRLGASYREQVGFRSPRHEEVIFAIAMVLPIAMLGDWLYSLARSLMLAVFSTGEGGDSLTVLFSEIHSVPLPMLVVALALGPAIGEELIFRGVIGRQLVSQFGTLPGSIMTVLLFSIAHASPAHAIATLPMACLLQFLYLKTGTLWVPIVVHFLNNLLAVVMVKYEITTNQSPSLFLLVWGFSYLAVLLVAFEYRRRSWSLL